MEELLFLLQLWWIDLLDTVIYVDSYFLEIYHSRPLLFLVSVEKSAVIPVSLPL
jgi:hypothetical protein